VERERLSVLQRSSSAVTAKLVTPSTPTPSLDKPPPIQGCKARQSGQRPGPTAYQGHSAQVRNLHVVNLRLWCNFSEVPGELLMGPGRFLRSYLPTPWLRTPVGLRPSTKGCGVFPGPIPPTEPKLFRDSTVAPLSIKSVSAWRAPSGPGTWTEGKDQVKEG